MLKERLANLIGIRSIVTILIVGTICYLAVIGKMPPEDIKVFGMVIITFFFAEKSKEQQNTIK